MKRVQVIGLPGAGKSVGIARFLESAPGHNWIDIRHFSGPSKVRLFRQALLSSPPGTVGESACGAYIPGDLVVRLNPPIDVVYRNCLERDGWLDEDYLSLLEGCMVEPHIVVSSPEELTRTLKRLFAG